MGVISKERHEIMSLSANIQKLKDHNLQLKSKHPKKPATPKSDKGDNSNNSNKKKNIPKKQDQ
eukprot:6220343-Ditylum_brightwellii.AAC.1